MPQRLTSHGLTFRPEYGVFTLRDLESDARVSAAEAIAEASRNVVASTRYELYVTAAQLDLPVRADVEVWDAEPDAPSLEGGWAFGGRARLPFYSGHVVLGDGGGENVDGPWLPGGPGVYDADVWFRRRDLALQTAQEIDEVTTGMDVLEKIRYQEQH